MSKVRSTVSKGSWRMSKSFLIRLGVVLLCSAAIMIMVSHNHGLYKRTVAEINSINEVKDGQRITATVLNGKHRGDLVSLTNKYDQSLVYGDKLKEGNKVFVKISGVENRKGESRLTGVINGMKRDVYVVASLLILFGLLALVGKGQGVLTILGLLVNVALFYAMIILYSKGINVLVLTIILCVLFSCIILVLINGINLKTAISLVATLAAVVVVGVLSAAVIFLGPYIPYDFMDFIPEPYTRVEANLFFLSEILVGCLGAIMDVAVTLTASSWELIETTPKISQKKLLLSAGEVADDITGTMINVVFFTNVASVIPVFLLSMANGIRFSTVLSNDAFFEIARFLTGSIGIVLTIPFSVFATSFFLKKGGKL